MRWGLLQLALIDLRQGWLRTALAASAIALAILAIAFFARQIELRRGEVLAGYEAAGAGTFIVRLSGGADDQVDATADSVRSLDGIRSVEVPYSEVSGQIVADTSFLVFRNQRQQEYLGARTGVLGVDTRFDLTRDYYVDFHEVNPAAPDRVLGMPLLGADGAARAPQSGEILVASSVADYVGVRPGAEATVELIYTGSNKPILRRLQGLRLIGTFNTVGPDQGRFEPFWRFSSQEHEVLTVRPPDSTGRTSLPVVLSRQTVQDFLSSVRQELGEAGMRLPSRTQLIIRASSIAAVPRAEKAVEGALRGRGLASSCDERVRGTFCMLLPERNNFRAALEQQMKIGTGGGFFIALLLLLLGVGTAGLQTQIALKHWREYGILQAVGFTPRQVLVCSGLRLVMVLFIGWATAGFASVLLPGPFDVSLLIAIGLAAVAAVVGAMPVLVWPLWRPAAELLREAA